MSMATDAAYGSFIARGEILVADQVLRPEVRSTAQEDGLIVATFESPGPSERGRLALLVESAVEAALEARGAAPPGIGASSDLDASLSDQLYRARLVGARGIALAVPPLEGIANLAGALDAEDSAVLRWWFAASRERPVRLILDARNRYLGVYGPPASLADLVGGRAADEAAPCPAPEVAASAEAMNLCDARPIEDEAVSVSPCISIEAEPVNAWSISERDAEMARREAELVAAMSVAEPPTPDTDGALRHPPAVAAPPVDVALPPPVIPFDDDVELPEFDTSDVEAELEEQDQPRAVQGELFGEVGAPSFPRLVRGEAVDEVVAATCDVAQPEPEPPRDEPTAKVVPLTDTPEDDWALSPALAAASFEAAIESLRAMEALRALDEILSERPAAATSDEHFDLEAALADCEPSPLPPSEALLSAPAHHETVAPVVAAQEPDAGEVHAQGDVTAPHDGGADGDAADETQGDADERDDVPHDYTDESDDADENDDDSYGHGPGDDAVPAATASSTMGMRTRALLGDLEFVEDEEAPAGAPSVRGAAEPVVAADLRAATAPAVPIPAAAATEPVRPERRASPLHPGADDAWPLWIRDLDAARGPKPLSVVERLFVSAYVPLADALDCGVAGPEAREALEAWALSFERSYCDAFDALRLRGKRPTMVLDLPEIALRIGRLHGARSIQLLLVDGLRFDLGLRMHEKLKGLVGQSATCAERLLLWSALPSTTSAQLQLIGRGPAGLRDVAGSGADVPVARGDLAAKPRRIKTGHRELLKLDLVEASMSEPGGPLTERLDSLAGGVARSVADHLERVAPRTLVVVFGDHGFRTTPLDGGTAAAQHGGARPEEVLVPAFAWLTGNVH